MKLENKKKIYSIRIYLIAKTIPIIINFYTESDRSATLEAIKERLINNKIFSVSDGFGISYYLVPNQIQYISSLKYDEYTY